MTPARHPHPGILRPADEPDGLLQGLGNGLVAVLSAVGLACRHKDPHVGNPAADGPLEPAFTEDEGRIEDASFPLDPLPEYFGIGHLRDERPVDKGRDLDPPDPAGNQFPNQAQLFLRRDDLLLVLDPVAQDDLVNFNLLWQALLSWNYPRHKLYHIDRESGETGV